MNLDPIHQIFAALAEVLRLLTKAPKKQKPAER